MRKFLKLFLFTILFAIPILFSCNEEEKDQGTNFSFKSNETSTREILINALADKIDLAITLISYARTIESSKEYGKGFAKIYFNSNTIPFDGSYKQSLFDKDIELIDGFPKEKTFGKGESCTIERDVGALKQIKQARICLGEVIDAAIEAGGKITVTVEVKEDSITINW